MKKISAKLRLIVTLCLTIFSYSALSDERYGILFPEEQQVLNAMKEAKTLGYDEPLDAPLDPLTVDSKLLAEVLDEPASTIEANANEALVPVTLEEQIQDQRLDVSLEQFGYEIFTTLPTTFAPVEAIPVPPDYIVGPGDEFIVQIFSSADLQYTLVVTREGKLLVPEIGDIQVAGLTFEESKLMIKESIAKTRMGVKVIVTLSNLHSIQVILVGEVRQPGSYTISGLSSLLNTLITTGGVKRSGSLRDIQVKRNGRLLANLDLYDLLLRGDTSSNIYLRHGDVIFIPPLGRFVSIAGEVVRPAIYELREEESVTDIVQLAGGLLPTADPSKTQIERIESSGAYSLVQVSLTAPENIDFIKNGDLIRVFPVIDKVERVVLLAGNVLTPGGFQWYEGMRISDLISGKDLLLQSTEFSVAAIERENPQTKRSEVLYFNLDAALSNHDSSNNIELLARDRVIIFRTDGNRLASMAGLVNKFKAQADADRIASTVRIGGAVRHSGEYPLAQGSRLLDIVRLSGGISTGVDRQYSLLVRTEPRNRNVSFIAMSLSKALSNRGGDHNPVIQPGDKIYLFDDQTYRPDLIAGDILALETQSSFGSVAPVVEVSGSVKQPGRYPLIPGMRVQDLILAAGGMKVDAYGAAATLARKVELDGQYSRTEEMDIALGTDDVMLNGERLILESGDHLVLRQKPEWITKPKRVTIAGEVAHPGTYEVDKRASICSLVNQAGGFTEDAYLFGAVFTRESVRQREQEALDRITRQMDDLLADVHLSPGVNKDTKLPTSQSTLDTYRVIQRLSPERAAGRMVIDLERAAASCDERADIVLEDGDRLFVPKYLDEVSVVGQVYFPQSHQFRTDRAALDYINLSGGTKELAQREHAYVVQANGEVLSVRSRASTWGWLLAPSNVKVTPGSTIYVPLSVDRINGREFTESWIDLFYKLTISAASVDFLFSGGN